MHATRDGDRVLVENRWTFDHTGQPGTVVEVNTRTTDREIEPEAGTGKKHYIRELIFPGIATVGLLLLLAHKSEFPVVANRYSFNYTILLSLFAVNLAFLWHRIVLRLFHQEEIKPLLTRALLCLVIFFIAVGFLLDFSIGSVISVREWVVFMLLGGVVAQAMAWRGYDIFIPHSLLAIVCSTALTLVLIEPIFVLFLLESRTPKTQREFLRLMTSSEIRKHGAAWSQPISFSKPPGAFRVLGLADSFGTIGGTTSNYHYLLEGILRRDVSPKIQMVNLSVPGYSLFQELAILRRFGMDYGPDLVLHGFFVGNDSSPDEGDVYIYHGIPTASYPGGLRYRPRNFLSRNWVEQALMFLRNDWRRRHELKLGVVDSRGTYSKSMYLKMQLDRMNAWAKGKESVERMKDIFPVLDAIRSTAEENGASYVMVIHPDETQVNNQLRQEIISTFQVNEADYDFDLPQKLLRSYCEEKRILCLDLLPLFRVKAKDGDLYLLRDTHYNHAGNELAATNIAKFLNDGELLAAIGRKTSGQAAQ